MKVVVKGEGKGLPELYFGEIGDIRYRIYRADSFRGNFISLLIDVQLLCEAEPSPRSYISP